MAESDLNVTAIGKRDADVAAELKAKAEKPLQDLCAIMAEARGHQMILQFDGIAQDAFGRYQVMNLRIVRIF